MTAIRGGKRIALAIGLLATVLLVGVLNVFTGTVPDLTVLYLVPIALATVYLGRNLGLATALATFVVEVVPLLAAGNHSPGLVVLDGLAHLAVRALGVILIDRLLRQLRTITELKQQRDSDLELAREVHEAFFIDLPDVPPGFEFGHRLEFLREVGGDFYHIEKRDGDCIFFCLGDIAGKGVSAALFTVALSQSVTAALQRNVEFTEVVRSINRRMIYALPTDRFVTLFACVIDSNNLTYTVAGSERPLVLRPGEPVAALDEAVTPPIGISRDAPIPTETIAFGTGDMLLAVTDGVTESPPFAADPERLAEVFAAYARSGAQAVCDRIVELLDDAGSIRDDVAVVCIRRVDHA